MSYDPTFHFDMAKSMAYRPLGKTDIKVSKIGLGAASFGNVYGNMTQDEINEMVLKALKKGINYIDTAPWYGQGASEKSLGIALKKIPRDKYWIATKVGRYEPQVEKMVDFSAAKVEQSLMQSLELLQLEYVDLIQVHEVESTQSINQIVHHTLPMLQKLKEKGLARYVGITGYNLGVLKKVVRLSPPGTIDTVLSYSRCNLINQDLLEDLEFFKRNGIGVINASPLALGLLNNEVNVPRWHVVNSLAPTMIKRACQKAALKCIEMNANLAKVGLQFAMTQDSAIATHLTSMINEQQLEANLEATFEGDPDPALIKELLSIFNDLPMTQWENLEVVEYWKEMESNGWNQNLD